MTLTLFQDGETLDEATLAFGESSELETLEAGNYRLEATDSSTGDLLWNSGNFSLSAGTRGLVMLL
ncbi:MAG: hypothetical protein U5O39_16830 [Gammaproteobacteria bacterium]|nr:hypothetical protein [Gammaproteobacteria bacterium]